MARWEHFLYSISSPLPHTAMHMHPYLITNISFTIIILIKYMDTQIAMFDRYKRNKKKFSSLLYWAFPISNVSCRVSFFSAGISVEKEQIGQDMNSFGVIYFFSLFLLTNWNKTLERKDQIFFCTTSMRFTKENCEDTYGGRIYFRWLLANEHWKQSPLYKSIFFQRERVNKSF